MIDYKNFLKVGSMVGQKCKYVIQKNLLVA